MFECEIFSLLGYAWVTPCFGKPSYIAMVTGEHPWYALMHQSDNEQYKFTINYMYSRYLHMAEW